MPQPLNLRFGSQRLVAALLGLATLLAALNVCAPARAELQPNQIVIIALRQSEQSQELARYYAQARQIPEAHICLIDATPGVVLSRQEWIEKTRPAIRGWLATRQLEQQIRCLVTVWDVPLKIGPRDPQSVPHQALLAHLGAQRKMRREQLFQLIRQLDTIAPDDTAPLRLPPGDDVTFRDLANQYQSALETAQRRTNALADPATVARHKQLLERLFVLGGGVASVVQALAPPANDAQAPTEAVRLFEFRRGELQGLRQGLNLLAGLPESLERDQQLLTLLQQSDGLLGALGWVEQQQALLQKNETYSSFDNEIALLYAPDYPLLRWQPNLLHYRFDNALATGQPRTLMVARLEAPTFELTRKLIDTALQVEKEGLAGKVYIDARGLPADQNPGSYGDYDQSLRDLADLLKQHTALEVVLDDKAALFQPGECPDAALYCGWYSLARYVPAFEWQPGCVAYHIASSEAVTLRDPDSQVWCKRMLEDGVAATVGPTYEPYLAAFPRPLDFFPLLLTGKLTLMETYARTCPFNSWVMVLVGDPLYNPFKNRPAFPPDNLPPHVKRLLGDNE